MSKRCELVTFCRINFSGPFFLRHTVVQLHLLRHVFSSSDRPSDRSLSVNTIYWKRIKLFWGKLTQVVYGTRAWHGQLWLSDGQRSRSHDAEDNFQAWRKHHSWFLGSSSFSTYTLALGRFLVAEIVFKSSISCSCITSRDKNSATNCRQKLGKLLHG